jgi:hypothetical protein
MAKAKAKKQTRSGAIRAYLAAHPSAGPIEVSKALKAKGIAVSPADVSHVQQADKSEGRSKRAASDGPQRSWPSARW